MCLAASKIYQALYGAFVCVLNYIIPYFTSASFRERVTVEAGAVFYAVSLPGHREWCLVMEFTVDVTLTS